MKTALINPETNIRMTVGGLAFPYGLGMVATVLYHAGFELDFFDLNARPFSLDDLAVKLSDASYEIVGFTVWPDNFMSFKETATRVRATIPKAMIVAGGPFASVAPEYVLEKTEADVVIPGNTTLTAPSFWADVSRGMIHQKWIVQPVSDLDELQRVPRCRYELLDMKNYINQKPVNLPGSRHGIAMSQFGCPYRCSFCAHGYQPYCKRSHGRFAEEICFLVERLGVDLVYIADAEINPTREHTLEICRTMVKFGVNWYACARTDVMDQDLAREFYRSGCRELWIGVESHAQQLLDETRKGFTVEQAERALNELRQAGIGVVGFLIFGLPGETIETLQRTVRWVKDVGLVTDPRIFYPLPGSKLWDYACGKDPSLSLDKLVGVDYDHIRKFGNVLTNVSRAPTQALIDTINELFENNRRLGSTIHPYPSPTD